MAIPEDVTPGPAEVQLAGAATTSGGVRDWLRAHPVLVGNLKVLLYALLIILCVLFAPEEPLQFIYTEF